MATAVVGGLGSYMARTAFLGSVGAVVQDPADRRDTILYGKQIVFDGNPWQIIEAVATDGTDIVLTTSWQRIPACNVTLTHDVAAGDLRVITETQLKETASATAVVELGIGKSDVAAPSGPSWEFSAIEADSDESYPATCICASLGTVGETLYLWARATSGAVTVRGAYIPAEPEGAKQRTSKMGVIVPFSGSGGSGGIVEGESITGP